MYGKIIDLMDDENFYKVPKFLEIAEISPLALYLFARMLDQYRYHVRHSDNKQHREMLALGWFWWTFPDIEKHVGIKPKQARGLIKELETVFLIDCETKRIGMEQRCWYRLNEDKIEFYLEKYRIKRSDDRTKELDAVSQTVPRTYPDGATDVSKGLGNQALSNQALSNQEKDYLEEFVQYWNSFALKVLGEMDYNLPQIIKLGSREKNLKERFKDNYFKENYRFAINRILLSDFCMGKNDRGWKADLEFFLRPDTVIKIMEGKYDNKKGTEIKLADGWEIINGKRFNDKLMMIEDVKYADIAQYSEAKDRRR